MAVGDDAKAAGYPLVPDTGEEGRVRWGGREINRTRDLIAAVKGLIPTLWPVNKGGTGASTATAARTNLGAASLTHTHNTSYYTRSESDGRYAGKPPLGGFTVGTVNTNNAIGWRWNGSYPVIRIDVTEFEMLRRSDVPGVSARRFKENIEDWVVDPADVLLLRPVKFDWLIESGVQPYGLIAEEVLEVLPEMVTWRTDPEVADSPLEVDGVNYSMLPVALLAVVKDQERRIKALEAQLNGTT